MSRAHLCVYLIVLIGTPLLSQEDCNQNGLPDESEFESHTQIMAEGAGGWFQRYSAAWDITGDGTKEIFAVDWDGVDIDGGQWGGGISGNGVTEVHTHDMNGDGREDLVFVFNRRVGIIYEPFPRPPSGRELFEGREISEEWVSSNLEFIDFDGDGRTDIVGGSHLLLRQKEDGTFEDRPLITETFGSLEEHTWGDFNADGRIDVALLRRPERDTTAGTTTAFALQSESGEFELQDLPGALHEASGALLAIDIDGDGRDELVIGRWNLAIWEYEPIFGFRNTRSFDIGVSQYSSDISKDDLDLDGIDDVLFPTHRGFGVLFGGTENELVTHEFQPNAPAFASGVDFDGDGSREVLASVFNPYSLQKTYVIRFARDGDKDDNGVLDSCEQPFRRGDANGDGLINISDSITTLGYLFLGSESPPCLDAADLDDNGSLDLTDGHLINVYLFLGGDPIPSPGPAECARDPSPDELSCGVSNCPSTSA